MPAVRKIAVLRANDSGPIHLASALGTPVVGIYWCGNVIGFGPNPTRGEEEGESGAWTSLAFS